MHVTVRGWSIAAVLGIVAFAYFLTKYNPEQRFTLFFINKGIANTALFLIALSFLYGPLCKIIPFLSHHIYARRYIGIAGFFAAVLHLTLSLLQFTDRFPIQWYFDHIIGVLAAIIATGIFTVLAVTSTSKYVAKLGSSKWKTVQRTGYIALVLVLIHIYYAAGPRWQMWLQGEVSMPNSVLMFSFGILVLIVRIIAYFIDKAKQKTPDNY